MATVEIQEEQVQQVSAQLTNGFVLPQRALVKTALIAHGYEPYALQYDEGENADFNTPNALQGLYEFLTEESATREAETPEDQARWFQAAIAHFSQKHRCPLALTLLPQDRFVQPYLQLWSDFSLYLTKITDATQHTALQATQRILERAVYSEDYQKLDIISYVRSRVHRATLQQVLTTKMAPEDCSVTQEFFGWAHYFFRAEAAFIFDFVAALKSVAAVESTLNCAQECFDLLQNTFAETITHPNHLVHAHTFRQQFVTALNRYRDLQVGNQNAQAVALRLLGMLLPNGHKPLATSIPVQQDSVPVPSQAKVGLLESQRGGTALLPNSEQARLPVQSSRVVSNTLPSSTTIAKRIHPARKPRTLRPEHTLISQKQKSQVTNISLTAVASYLASVVFTKGAALAWVPGATTLMQTIADLMIDWTGATALAVKTAGLLTATMLDTLIFAGVALTTALSLQQPKRTVAQSRRVRPAQAATDTIQLTPILPIEPSPWRNLFAAATDTSTVPTSQAQSATRDLDLFALMHVTRNEPTSVEVAALNRDAQLSSLR